MRAVVDDMSRPFPLASIGSSWQLFTDRVMGGISRGELNRETVAGRAAVRMRGDVRRENNGGFVQMSLDLATDGGPVDARCWRGIELDVIGNGETYNVHFRTGDLTRPWQSYRQSFTTAARWQTVLFYFNSLVPHRTEAPFDPRRLQRIGIVAIGRAFTADISVAGLRYFA